MGAKAGGAKGFAMGLGAGIFMGVALPITGVCNGVVQIGRGLCNTVEAVEARVAGKVWDYETQGWIVYVPYNLKDEASTVLRGEAEGEAGEEVLQATCRLSFFF